MIEAFLINPPRSIGRGKGIRMLSPHSGIRSIAKRRKRLGRWGPSPGDLYLGLDYRGKKRRTYPFSRVRSKNPFGEEIMIVGGNPRRTWDPYSEWGIPKRKRRKRRTTRSRARTAPKRKEVSKPMARRKRRRRRRASIAEAFALPRRRRRRRRVARARTRRRRRRVAAYAPRRRRRVRARRRRRRVAAYAPPRRRRRRRRRAAAYDRYGYPVRRRRRRRRRASASYAPRRRRTRSRRRRLVRRRGYLRNPPAIASLSWRRPMTLLMPAAVGTAGFFLTGQAPGYVNVVGTLPVYGVKAAVMIGGGMLVSKFLGSRNGQIWMLGSLINIASDVLKQFVFKTAVAGLSGNLGAFPYQGIDEYPSYAAYPEEFSSPYGAFPY